MSRAGDKKSFDPFCALKDVQDEFEKSLTPHVSLVYSWDLVLLQNNAKAAETECLNWTGLLCGKIWGEVASLCLILNLLEWWAELTSNSESLRQHKAACCVEVSSHNAPLVSRAAQSCLALKVPELPILSCIYISQGSYTEIQMVPRWFQDAWNSYFPLYLMLHFFFKASLFLFFFFLFHFLWTKELFLRISTSWQTGSEIELRISEFHFLIYLLQDLPKITSILSPLACLDSRVLKARAASPSEWNLVWLKSIAKRSQDAALVSRKGNGKIPADFSGAHILPYVFNRAFISAGEWNAPAIQILALIKYLSCTHSALQGGERDREQSFCPGKLPAARHEGVNYRRNNSDRYHPGKRKAVCGNWSWNASWSSCFSGALWRR